MQHLKILARKLEHVCKCALQIDSGPKHSSKLVTKCLGQFACESLNLISCRISSCELLSSFFFFVGQTLRIHFKFASSVVDSGYRLC